MRFVEPCLRTLQLAVQLRRVGQIGNDRLVCGEDLAPAFQQHPQRLLKGCPEFLFPYVRRWAGRSLLFVLPVAAVDDTPVSVRAVPDLAAEVCAAFPTDESPEKGVTALVRPPRCLRFASSAWTSSNTSALTIAGWLFST